MSLFSVMAEGSRDIYAFHFPSIFRADEIHQGEYLVATGQDQNLDPLFEFLQLAKLVSWGGRLADMPALNSALPLLGECIGHVDFQDLVRDLVAREQLSWNTPFNLEEISRLVLKVSLDKTYVLENWYAFPRYDMLEYAAKDVIATNDLYRLYKNETLGSFLPPVLNTPEGVLMPVWDELLLELTNWQDPIPFSLSSLVNVLVNKVGILHSYVLCVPERRVQLNDLIERRLGEAVVPEWVKRLLPSPSFLFSESQLAHLDSVILQDWTGMWAFLLQWENTTLSKPKKLKGVVNVLLSQHHKVLSPILSRMVGGPDSDKLRKDLSMLVEKRLKEKQSELPLWLQKLC